MVKTGVVVLCPLLLYPSSRLYTSAWLVDSLSPFQQTVRYFCNAPYFLRHHKEIMWHYSVFIPILVALCMYHVRMVTHIAKILIKVKVTNPARVQLNRENEYFLVHVRA